MTTWTANEIEQYCLDLQADEAYEKWRAVAEMEHGDCPADGPCLVEPDTGHTTEF